MLDWLYEHAMYATDPVQRLRLFERRLQAVSELRFHRELAAVFRGLRDMHTAYQLPAHYRGRVAALVILVEPYQDRDGTPRM